jgi:hypothetical protein
MRRRNNNPPKLVKGSGRGARSPGVKLDAGVLSADKTVDDDAAGACESLTEEIPGEELTGAGGTPGAGALFTGESDGKDRIAAGMS